MSKKLQYVLVPFDDIDWVMSEPEIIDNMVFYDKFHEVLDHLGYDDKKTETELKRIIKKYPFHIDSYVHLHIAFLNQRKLFESFLTAEKAFYLAKSCIPVTFNPNKHKIRWSFIENRPFLRAYHNYGLACIQNKDFDTAITVFKQMLTFSPNDNTGVRYLLLEIYFKNQDYDNAKQLIEYYQDDFSIDFTFGQVALAVLDDNLILADELLQNAIKTNSHFINEMKKDKHIKVTSQGGFGMVMGSVEEAYDYWNRNKTLYKNKKILNYLKSK